MKRAKAEPCHWCAGTGVEPAKVVRCMSCSTPVRSLRESRQPCPNRGPKHTLSIGDSIVMGEKFKAKDLRQWLGEGWKAEVERIRAGR